MQTNEYVVAYHKNGGREHGLSCKKMLVKYSCIFAANEMEMQMLSWRACSFMEYITFKHV
jgi:hypothetical protein